MRSSKVRLSEVRFGCLHFTAQRVLATLTVVAAPVQVQLREVEHVGQTAVLDERHPRRRVIARKLHQS